MEADIHALLLLALILVAVVTVGLTRRRRPANRQMIFALGVAVGVAFIAWTLNHHLCREGTPRNQWLIPCLLMFIVLAFPQARRWRWIGGTVIALGMVGLSCHFTALVHSSGWTGNPDWDGGASALERATRTRFDEWMDQAPNRAISFPAGWLDKLPPWEPEANMGLGGWNVYRREVERVWHSRLTGLYRYRKMRRGLWYPGGPLADAAARVEVRDRPGSTN